jgi:hypothetical protein
VEGAGAPANDNFAQGLVLSGPLLLASGTTFGASVEAGEPTQIQTNTAAGRYTVWYTWVAPLDGMAQVLVRPDVPSVRIGLRIHLGESLEALVPVVAKGVTPNEGAFDTVTRWNAVKGQTYRLQVNANQDTDFNLSVSATFDEEWPRLGLIRSGKPPVVHLELSSLRRRRLEVQATSDWVSWEPTAELWLEGTTGLIQATDGPPASRYFRVLAY